jgi:hypothetical protein
MTGKPEVNCRNQAITLRTHVNERYGDFSLVDVLVLLWRLELRSVRLSEI